MAGVLTHSRVNQVGRAQPASWNEVPTRAGRASSGRSSLDRAEHDNARSRPLEMGRRGHWIDARIHRHNAVRPATCRFQKCGGFLKTSIWKPRRLFVRSDYRPMYSLMYSLALGTMPGPRRERNALCSCGRLSRLLAHQLPRADDVAINMTSPRRRVVSGPKPLKHGLTPSHPIPRLMYSPCTRGVLETIKAPIQ